MSLRIGERQRATPRTTEHLPLVDAEMLAQLLDIADEIPSRVLFDRSMRRTLPRTSLIEKHDAIRRWVVKLTILRRNTSTRPAVQKHDRLAVRIAALLVVDVVKVRDL